MSDVKERDPILWLGDATPDADVWELTRWPGVMILGGPTILYLKADPPVAVPAGWWICDDNGRPFAASRPVRAARAESEGTRQRADSGDVHWLPKFGGSFACGAREGFYVSAFVTCPACLADMTRRRIEAGRDLTERGSAVALNRLDTENRSAALASRDGQGETHRETVEVRPSGLSGFTWKRIALGWWGLYTVGDVHAGDVWDVAENNRRAWEEWEARRAARGVPGAPEPYNADEDVDPFTWHTWDRHGVGGENASARTLDAAMRDVEEALVRQDWHVPGPDEGTGGGS